MPLTGLGRGGVTCAACRWRLPSHPGVPEPLLPIASVAVDVPLAHLDRPFDYAVTPEQDAEAVPGARVRVRFSGRLRDGFVLERRATSDHEGRLTPLHKVISAEPVLTGEVAALVRAVADHYAGTFADVMRLAVPPRHAATEKAEPQPPAPLVESAAAGAPARLPDGSRVSARAAGRGPAAGPVAGDAERDGQRGLGRRAGRGGPGLRRRRSRGGAGGARPARPGAADSRLCHGAGPGSVRRPGRRGGSRRPLPGVPGGAARAGQGGDRQPRGGVRPGPRPGPGRAVGRRRRPAGRAARTVPAHPRRAGPARRGGRRGGAAGRLRPDRGDADLARSRLADRARRGPAGGAAHRAAGQGDRRLRPGPGARPGGPGRPAAARGVRDRCGPPCPRGRCWSRFRGPATGWRWSARVAGSRSAAGSARDRPGSTRRRQVLPECTWCGRRQVDWACPICESRSVRAPVVGATRTAEELGARVPADPGADLGRRADAGRCPGHPEHRGRHARRGAAGRGRVRRRGAAGHHHAAAPARPARRPRRRCGAG